jgi:CMP-N,N'-diacetyllegionaminic acid synthase
MVNKILIVGFGSIGKRHFSILKELLPDADFTIVTKQKVNDNKVSVFQNLEDIKNLQSFDYIVISSETYKHYSQLKFITEQVNEKIILVEKPLFHKYMELSPGNNRVFVAYNLRFHPIIQKIKEETEVESPIFLNAIVGQYLPTWRPGRDYRKVYSASREKGGGVLLDLSHEIDYLQWIGGEIEKIMGFDVKLSSLEINSDDLASAIGKTRQGAIVNFSMDYISKIPIRKLVVHTDKRTFIGDLIEGKLTISDSEDNREEKLFKIDRNFTYREMHKELLYGKK